MQLPIKNMLDNMYTPLNAVLDEHGLTTKKCHFEHHAQILRYNILHKKKVTHATSYKEPFNSM